MDRMGSGKDWESWRAEAQAEVEAAVIQVSAEPVPDPFEEDWWATKSGAEAEGLGSP